MNSDIVFCCGNTVSMNWKRMVDLIGIRTMMILIRRTLWLTSQKYSEAELIEYDEEGFYLDGFLEQVDPILAKAITEELGTTLSLTTKRLVGPDVVSKLAEENAPGYGCRFSELSLFSQDLDYDK